MGNPWKLYDELIAGVPEDVLVRDYCLGTHWSYVDAECGTGIAYTASGGARPKKNGGFMGWRLKDVAALAKSWVFEEATIGIAALNAWYSNPERLAGMNMRYDEPVELPDGTIRKVDAFELYRPQMGGSKVTVIGHFPHVDRIAEYADLTVLERRCTDALDTPDPACEYVVPGTDYLFMTGVTLINKTAPRLLDLAADAHTIMVGPSVVMAPKLFDYGVEMLAGSVVADSEKAIFSVKNGVPQFFGEALQMCSLVK